MVFSVIKSLSVIVMHSDPIFAAGLVAALRQHEDLAVSVDGVDVLQGASAFDIAITDYQAGLDLSIKQRDHEAGPLDGARILVVSTRNREHEVRTALEHGVHGYLLLGCGIEELVTGVRTIGRGAKYLCLDVAQRVVDIMTRESLTGREKDVLALLARGNCNKTIANTLDIAVGTVKAHVKSIMRKLDAASRTEAVSIAGNRGMVSAEAADRAASTDGRHLRRIASSGMSSAHAA